MLIRKPSVPWKLIVAAWRGEDSAAARLGTFSVAHAVLTVGLVLSTANFSTAQTQPTAAPPNQQPGVAGVDELDGVALWGALRCFACHAGAEAQPEVLQPLAPRLGEVGARVTPGYLREFLADPQRTKPGTAMPQILHAVPASTRHDTLEDLVHFLVSLGGPIRPETAPPDAKQVARGEQLYHSVGCVACHEPFAPPPVQKVDLQRIRGTGERAARESIPFVKLPLKTNGTALAQFLAHPLHARPAGRMPSLHLTADESQAIASYLLREPTAPAAEFRLDQARAQRGRAQFAALGCANCHDTSVRPEPQKIDLALRKATVTGFDESRNESPTNESPRHAVDGNPKTKYLNFGAVGSGLLFEIPGAPTVLRLIELTSANDYPERDPAALAIAGSQDGKSFVPIADLAVPEFTDRFQTRTVALENTEAFSTYRLTFTKLRGPGDSSAQIAEVALLASPKPQPGITSTARPATPLARLDSSKGCLAETAAPASPQFTLSAAQRHLLRTGVVELRKAEGRFPASVHLARITSALRCLHCHVRGQQGGPDDRREAYFSYAVPVDLGDEGRLPPALHDVGAKLTADGFHDSLVAGTRYRSAMATRMPAFGVPNVRDLPALFATVDEGKIPAWKSTIVGNRVAKAVTDGRQLVGKTALSCINCHAWGEYRLPGAEGLDLQLAPRRLQPAWFHALLADPQQLRPRTRMPAAWPQGQSFYPDLQEGDMHRQIDAVWAYLSQGVKGGLPKGFTPQKTGPLLEPIDEPIVFRTFVDNVGAHAILVGFKQKVHFAFDANRVRGVLGWSGEFIGTNAAWEGRAGNYASIPSKEIVMFPEGPPLAQLESNASPWPGDVPKGKLGSTRTPEGWRFRGYRYDAERTPTFLYTAGPIEVQETPTADFREQGACLVRTFKLRSRERLSGWHFRVATGAKISAIEKTPPVPDGAAAFQVDDKLHCVVTSAAAPFLREASGRQELVVPLAWKVVDGGWEAAVQFELVW